MALIQQELQTLSESLKALDSNSLDPEYSKKRQIILLKADQLKKEFKNILVRLQVKQSLVTQTLPSDDVSSSFRSSLSFDLSTIFVLADMLLFVGR